MEKFVFRLKSLGVIAFSFALLLVAVKAEEVTQQLLINLTVERHCEQEFDEIVAGVCLAIEHSHDVNLVFRAVLD